MKAQAAEPPLKVTNPPKPAVEDQGVSLPPLEAPRKLRRSQKAD